VDGVYRDMLDAAIPRRRRAALFLRKEFNPRELAPHQICGAVSGAIVYHDDLKGDSGMVLRAQTLESEGNQRSAVVKRHNDRHIKLGML
jgi:hypothetical protein